MEFKFALWCELRDKMYDHIKSLVPHWPDYIVMDLLYKGQGFKNYDPSNAASFGYQPGQSLRDIILSPDFRIGPKRQPNPMEAGKCQHHP